MLQGIEVEIGESIKKRTEIFDLAKDEWSTERAIYVVQAFVAKLYPADDNELVVFAGELARLRFKIISTNGTIAEVFRNPQMLTHQLMAYIFKKYHFPCPTNELRNFFESCHNLRNLPRFQDVFLKADEFVIQTLLPVYYEFITLNLTEILKQRVFNLKKILKKKILTDNLPQLRFSFDKELQIHIQHDNQELNELLLRELSIKKKELTKTFLSQVGFSFIELIGINLPGEGEVINLQLIKEFKLLLEFNVMQDLAKRLDKEFLSYQPTSFQDKLKEKQIQIIQCYEQAVANYSAELEQLISNCKLEFENIKTRIQTLQSRFKSESEGYQKLKRTIDEMDMPHQFNNSNQINESKNGIIENFKSVMNIINADKVLKNTTKQDVRIIKEMLGLAQQKRISRGFNLFQKDDNQEQKEKPTQTKSSKRSHIKSNLKKDQGGLLTINFDRLKESASINSYGLNTSSPIQKTPNITSTKNL